MAEIRFYHFGDLLLSVTGALPPVPPQTFVYEKSVENLFSTTKKLYFLQCQARKGVSL